MVGQETPVPPVDPGVVEVTREQLDGGGVLLAVAGELDLYTMPELRGAVQAALDSRADPIVVDLSAVTFIDSVSLAVLVAAQRELQPERRLGVVIDRDSYAMMIFDVCGVDSVLQLFDSREQALAALAG